MRYTLIIIVFLFFCPLHITHAEEDLVKAGQELSKKLCAKCHAIGTSGNSPFQDAPPFRALSKKWPIDNLQEALAEGIVVGHPDMPQFKFDAFEVGAIIEYLKSIQDEALNSSQ